MAIKNTFWDEEIVLLNPGKLPKSMQGNVIFRKISAYYFNLLFDTLSRYFKSLCKY